MRRAAAKAALACAIACWALPGCSAEDAFTAGRLRVLCDEVIPVCDRKASCVLDDQTYLDEQFPGGHRFVAHSREDGERLVLRILIVEAVFPGTELSVRVHNPGCIDFVEERQVDRDLFEIAGEDGIIEISLPMGPRGDHLVEVFSDMSARYLMTVELE